MSNPVDFYRRHMRHIAAILQSLKGDLERHEAYATCPENASKLWDRISELAMVKILLKAPLIVLSGLTEGEIEAALSEYDDQVDRENGGRYVE